MSKLAISENEVTPIIMPGYQESEFNKKAKKENKLKNKLKKVFTSSKAKKKKVKKERVLNRTPELLPFLTIEDDYIELKNGVMDILQISSRDLHSLSEEEKQMMIYSRAGHFKSYFPGLKEVSLNFPTNTSKQKTYWMKKKDKTEDPLRLRFIERKLFELDFLEKERTNREFFLFVFAENESQLRERKQQLMKSGHRSFPLQVISIEKKIDTIYLLNNQNTKL